MIFDVTILIVLGWHKLHPYKVADLIVEMTKDLEYWEY